MIDLEKLLEDLTPEQREAVTHVDGPLLIVAGAGSGKTRVITRRVAYLIRQGIPAYSILSITFTNKAAGEMKARISQACGQRLYDFGRLDQPWPIICTFHSLCLRILRHYAERVGLPPNFTIYDSGDQNKVVKEALKQLDISSTNFSPGAVHSAIGNAKNKLISAALYAQHAGDFFSKTVARIYVKYQALLKQNNALDFDDLLLMTAEAFRDHPRVLAELQERFAYILIDEYQDTNHAQYVLAHSLALKHRNICVVGDPDQSVYAWRGADIQNILDFEQDYADAKVVRLERNYRSTKTILAIASKLIANNRQRKDKRLWTENPAGEPAEVYFCQDEHDEARVVTGRLKDMHEQQGHAWSKMAVFYRMNALSRVMEDALRRAGVPYQIARGVEFYNRKEIKDVLALLRVIANPSDEVSLARVVNVPPRGIGESAVRQMQVHAGGNGLTLMDAMRQCRQVAGLSARAANAVAGFVELVRGWRRLAGLTGAPAPGAEPSSAEPPPAEAASAGDEAPVKPARKKRAAPAAKQNDDAGEGWLYGADVIAGYHADPDSPPPSGDDAAATFRGSRSVPAPIGEQHRFDSIPHHDRPGDGPAPPGIDASSDASLDPRAPHAPAPDPVVHVAGAKGRVQTVMEAVVRGSGMETLLRKLREADKERDNDELANVEQLISSAAEYDRDNPDGSLVDYLALVSLVSDADHLKDSGGAVTLMTLHAAKGLEFPVVAMIGLEEGVLPHSRARGNPAETEEERRLCFVGITRAEDRLFLTKANYRTNRGLRERTVTSPFLNELPQEALKITDRAGLDFGERPGERRLEERRLAESEAARLSSQFRPGQLVRHPKFGLGRIVELVDAGSYTRAVVRFNTSGEKRLVLQYANLEVAE